MLFYFLKREDAPDIISKWFDEELIDSSSLTSEDLIYFLFIISDLYWHLTEYLTGYFDK